MERFSSATQPPAGQEHSTGELVRQLSEQVFVLVCDELKLAWLEMARKGKQGGPGRGNARRGLPDRLVRLAGLLAYVVTALSSAVTA